MHPFVEETDGDELDALAAQVADLVLTSGIPVDVLRVQYVTTGRVMVEIQERGEQPRETAYFDL